MSILTHGDKTPARYCMEFWSCTGRSTILLPLKIMADNNKGKCFTFLCSYSCFFRPKCNCTELLEHVYFLMCLFRWLISLFSCWTLMLKFHHVQGQGGEITVLWYKYDKIVSHVIFIRLIYVSEYYTLDYSYKEIQKCKTN